MAVTQDADWWPRLDAAFQGALELPEGERAGYLDRVCGVDGGLRAEVDAMLTADAPEHALEIERLVHDGGEPSLDPDPFIGMRLGPWLVVDVLGRGGMGTVYLAERDDGQYEQRVALKLVRGPARDGPLRFTAESHILARLVASQHRPPDRRRPHTGGLGVPGDGVRRRLVDHGVRRRRTG